MEHSRRGFTHKNLMDPSSPGSISGRELVSLNKALRAATIGPKQWGGKTFENAFTGSSLVDKLLQNKQDFDCREKARSFAQDSLTDRCFHSIIKSRTFEDGEQWYYWSADDISCRISKEKPSKPSVTTRQRREENTDNKPIWATAKLRTRTSAISLSRLLELDKKALVLNKTETEMENSRKKKAGQQLSKGLAALLAMDQEFSKQDMRRSSDEEEGSKAVNQISNQVVLNASGSNRKDNSFPTSEVTEKSSDAGKPVGKLGASKEHSEDESVKINADTGVRYSRTGRPTNKVGKPGASNQQVINQQGNEDSKSVGVSTLPASKKVRKLGEQRGDSKLETPLSKPFGMSPPRSRSKIGKLGAPKEDKQEMKKAGSPSLLQSTSDTNVNGDTGQEKRITNATVIKPWQKENSDGKKSNPDNLFNVRKSSPIHVQSSRDLSPTQRHPPAREQSSSPLSPAHEPSVDYNDHTKKSNDNININNSNSNNSNNNNSTPNDKKEQTLINGEITPNVMVQSLKQTSKQPSLQKRQNKTARPWGTFPQNAENKQNASESLPKDTKENVIDNINKSGVMQVKRTDKTTNAVNGFPVTSERQNGVNQENEQGTEKVSNSVVQEKGTTEMSSTIPAKKISLQSGKHEKESTSTMHLNGLSGTDEARQNLIKSAAISQDKSNKVVNPVSKLTAGAKESLKTSKKVKQNGISESRVGTGSNQHSSIPENACDTLETEKTIELQSKTIISLKEEIRKLKEEQESVTRSYESKLSQLKNELEISKTRQVIDSDNSVNASVESEGTSISSQDNSQSGLTPPAPPPPAAQNVVPPPPPPPPGGSGPPPPPPPPGSSGPPPPPPPGGLSGKKRSGSKPKKATIKPDAEMKPLFWNRIILSDEVDGDPNNNGGRGRSRAIWDGVLESEFNTNEFSKLFRRKAPSKGANKRLSLKDDLHFLKGKGKEVTKVLEKNRSQMIGIIMGSINCHLEDIKDAIYKMDSSVVDMDGLKALYDIRPKADEIELIERQLKKNSKTILDKPEEFLLQMHKIRHFSERLECWLFRDSFTETLLHIDRRLSAICEASSEMSTNREVVTLLSIILALGNYMNGGTARGQADGFQMNVLQKLKDVKTQDGSLNLLQYVVRLYCVKTEGKGVPDFTLPDPYCILAASQVSLQEIRAELSQAQMGFATCKEKAHLILSQVDAENRNPFETNMTVFFNSNEQDLDRLQDKLKATEEEFEAVMGFYRFTGEAQQELTPSYFFGIWGNFLEDFKNYWKAEQILMKKGKFNNKEHLQQIKATATKFRKRRDSTVKKP